MMAQAICASVGIIVFAAWLGFFAENMKPGFMNLILFVIGLVFIFWGVIGSALWLNRRK